MNAATRSNIVSWWDELERAQRIGLVGGIVTIVVAIAVYIWFSLRTDYVPLTGDLSKDDTASVVAQLEDIRARYKVDPDTGALLVPAAEVDATRAQLAQKGWPLKPAPGFELFDSGDFGMTEFTEKINYQRALEGELARTIMSVDAIRYARVHLVLPQSTLFKKTGESPKASVLLIARRRDGLSEAQIAGIQRMVASAVPELKAENVSIHDQRGITLGGGSADGLSPMAVDAAIHAESDVEDYLTAKADEILARIFPKGTATVSVNVVLSRSQTSSVRDEVLPAGQGAAAVSRLRSDTLPEGLGVGSSKAGRESLPKSEASGPQFDVEYRVGHVTEQSESAPGGIQRITVGVVIPDPVSQGLTVADVQELVAAGIGIDPQRGDRIAVYPVASLSKSAVEQGLPAAAHSSDAVAAETVQSERPKPYWLLFLGLALFFAVVVIFMGRPRGVRNLSKVEREQVLHDVREWLQQ